MSEKPTVFIGSSSESLKIAYAFQMALETAAPCEVEVWDQGTFVAGQYTMASLREKMLAVDFAVMVMAPDDVVESRGTVGTSPRDNVVFELGLFMGALGMERVFMLTPKSRDLRVPSDLNGITRLSPYDPERQNLRSALTMAAHDAGKAIERHGKRCQTPTISPGTARQRANWRDDDLAHDNDHERAKRTLAAELEMLRRNGESQGWGVLRTNSATTFRIQSPKGRRFSFAIPEDAIAARDELRTFTRTLRAEGLRVNQRIRRPAR